MIELERPQRWLQPPWGMSQEGTLTMSNSKTCNKCGQTLTLDLFGKDSKFSDGLRTVCKPCNNSQANSYYLSNKDAINKKRAIKFAEDYKANPEAMRLQSKIRQANYRKANPSKAKESFDKWLINNPGANYQATKKWRAKNPDKVKEANLKRRALKLNATTFLVTDKDIRRIMSQPCIYCGQKAEHLDHIIPLVRGGSHGVGNLAPACAKCNTTKNKKFIMEWRTKWS